MDQNNNVTDVSTDTQADGTEMELYSIVLSATVLIFAILFGGGGCITVLIAMFVHRLLRKLRFVLIGILLFVCCIFDLIWCPIEITRLVIHHQNINGNTVSTDAVKDLKYVGSSLYVLLLCTIAAMVVLICVQNLLKIVRKYDNIPKMMLGVIFVLIWLIISISLTIAYILVSYGDQDDQVYHSINRKSFHFKLGLQTLWIVLLLIPILLMISIHVHTKFWKTKILKEVSDLHSTDNFTVPSLIIKSVEEIDEDENEDESSVALPSPDVVKDSASGSPVSKSSKSALKKRSGSPSSQKVVFADTPSPTREEATPSPKFGDRFKSPNHLGVNMAAILGRRRHTIAQISDPHLDLMQKAKTYNYVRKFSVDISALQAQLENPKLSSNFPFHSQQDIKASPKEGLEKTTFGSQQKCNRRSRDEIMKSQEIAEEPEKELESENEMNESNETKTETVTDVNETQSVQSQNVSICSARSPRDSICPTPPLISLTQSDGEEKQIEITNDDNNLDDSFQSSEHVLTKLHKPCKLSCLLVATFILSILPMFVTEILRDHCLSPNAYINVVTCMTAISTVQTMIYPQVIFCVDANINKAVNQSLTHTRMWILQLFSKQHPVATTDDISDTEV
ncbi:uncharacterized protein LOC123557588 [Mercenaria mercenaria]|uniref:uncharacterized protein LOC123557588 n=1 Tax=Mercenaria mercenaria TaxID=6596 RepID=UPI00234EBCD1|nr:uncharacterized protein LOC123557588 [Mercenaria mercenaria]XP_045205076.2 uncharacterized protein LOC123557588 [Mercenaria mercenaria]